MLAIVAVASVGFAVPAKAQFNAEGLMRDMVGIMVTEAIRSGAANAQEGAAAAGKQAQGAGGVIQTTESDLTRAEAKRLQEQLNRIGYDVGKPDGVVGRKTKAALADFIERRDLPANMSMRDAFEHVMDAEPAATPVQSAGGTGFDALSALATGKATPEPEAMGTETGRVAEPPPGQQFDMVDTEYAVEHPDVTRMLVAAKPALLDNKEFLAELFQGEGRRFTSTYRVEEELEAFKSEYLARPVPEVVYLDLTYGVSLHRSEYERERGLFPFYRGFRDEEPEGFINITASLGERYVVSFAAPTMPVVDGVPMTLEEAEAFERERFGRNDDSFFMAIHRKVAISGIRHDEVRDAFTGDLTLFSVEGTKRFGDEKGEVLFNWPLRDPGAAEEAPVEVARVASLGELAAILPGIVVVDGHFDLRQSPGWPHVVASLFLNKVPNALTDMDLLIAMGRGLLTEGEQQALWRGEPPYGWTNIDDRRDLDRDRTARLLWTEYGPAIGSRAIDPDLKIVDVIEARFGAYDAATGLMALDYERPENLLRSEQFGNHVTWSLGGAILPRALPLDATLAQSLIATYGGDPAGQTVRLAVFADVTNVALDEEGRRTIYGLTLDATPTRIALYKDAELGELVFDYYADPNGWLLAQQRGKDELRELVALEAPNLDVIHSIAMSSDPAYLEDLLAYTLKESRLNEFERLEAKERIERGLAAAEAPEKIWLRGDMNLGEYDISSASFGISDGSLQLEYQRSAVGAGGDPPPVTFLVPLTSVAVPAPDARRFIEQSDEYREVDIRMLVQPVHAVVQRERNGEPVPMITYHLERLVVLQRVDYNGTRELLADIDYGPYSGVASGIAEEGEQAGADLPERPVFDQELAALMSFDAGAADLSEMQYRRLLGSRWLVETQPGFAPSIERRFFANGAALPPVAGLDLYREKFATWMASTGSIAPTKLRVHVDFSDNQSATRLPAQCSDMEWGLRYVFQNQDIVGSLFGDAGSSLQDVQMRHIGQGTDEKPSIVENFLLGFPRASLADCNIEATRGVASTLDLDADPAPGAFIIVDKMPVPNFLSRSRYNGAVVDLAVTKIERRPSVDGLPLLVIHATTENVDLVTASIESGVRVVADTRSFSREAMEPEVLGLDLLGIKVGTSEAEADRLVRAYMSEPLVLRSRVDPSPSTPPFSDVTMYVSANQRERIALFYEAGTGERTVLGVQRVIYAPDWGLARSDVSASAIAKYGKPAFEENTDYSTILAWGPAAEGRYCREVGEGAFLADNWVNEAGEEGRIPDFIPWEHARDSGIAYLPEPFWNDDMARCPGIVLLKQDEYRLKTMLIDPALYHKSWLRSLEMANELIAKKVEQGGSTAIAF